jgi:hypothetical protein
MAAGEKSSAVCVGASEFAFCASCTFLPSPQRRNRGEKVKKIGGAVAQITADMRYVRV